MTETTTPAPSPAAEPAQRQGAPLPGADQGPPVDAEGKPIPVGQRTNVQLNQDAGPGADQQQPGQRRDGRTDLSRPDANEKQAERDRLAKKARERREGIVARDDADHAEVAAYHAEFDAAMQGKASPGQADGSGTPQPTAAAPAAAQAAATPPATPTPGISTPTPPQGVDTGENYVTVKVYGIERRVPKAAVDAAGGITAYQKNLAAEERMQQAATRERENEAERQRLKTERENLERQRTTPPAQTQPPTPGAGADRKARALAITRTLYSGNETATAAAIEELMGATGTGQPTLDPAQIAEKAAQMLEQRAQERSSADAAQRGEAARVNVNTLFKTVYPELASDESKTLYTQGLLRARVNNPANRGRDLEELAIEAAEQALTDFGIRRPAGGGTQVPPQVSTELQRREDAKRLGPFEPSPSARAPAPQEAPGPKTRSEIVAAVRASRGQPKL